MIKKQKLDSKITAYLVEVLTRNKMRNKDEYTFYTDGALYKEKRVNSKEKMGIGWVQINKEGNWPEEETALGLEGWPSATTAEFVAIWSAILTVPEGKNIEVHTDSLVALRNINRAI
jgi:ribonuclease HI